MHDVKDYFKGLGNHFSKDFNEFLNLIPLCEQFDSNEVSCIYKALYKAMELHKGQVRKSGEAYINHPIGAASILASYGLDFETVSAALLHDTIEDTSYSLSECAFDFGDTIASLVDGATKIGRDVNNFTHKKILDNIKLDARSLAVKAGDRLHNMYTLEALSQSKQKEIATETKNFYVPIAKILGIYKLKDEFQDLCLYYLDKEEFLNYYELRNNLKKIYNKDLVEIGNKTQEILSHNGLAMNYEYRVKNVGGIYEESKSGLEVRDLLAIKMILKNKEDCYATLDAIRSFCLDSGPLVDYILKPKFNGYRSINTNVVYKDKDVQIRIRTKKMQEQNNLGVFSDWNDGMQDRLNSGMKYGLDALAKKIKL